ncbi:11208_t:CDS:10 [Racocetra persica]|uniref:11208_t:CDS:1 n=1 Tax=Racocetra persica TaxID=160502 RepID=A0ACA9KAK9_9GLOM|nr:11208_t:CDS:10 [Racocetra persica]
MKFNKALESSLENFPPDWKPFLIQYKTLKRCIKAIVQELNAKGVLQIMANEGYRIEYSFECYKPECTFEDGPVCVRPCVKVCPNCHGRAFEEPLHFKNYNSISSLPLNLPNNNNMELSPLEIYQLNLLQKRNQEKFLASLKNLKELLIEVTSPFKNDMYTWRNIFQIYTENKIFVGNTESDREERNWEFSQNQLTSFIDRINKSYLVKRLKHPLSKTTFEIFLKLNHSLVSMKQFQDINQKATSKLIKKHDKKTSLVSYSNFNCLIEKYLPLSKNEFKSLCYEMEQLTTIIPQLDDYSCPICLNIAWKPIRLCCMHIFCVRCLVKSGRKGMRNCPICRAKDALYNVEASNLDVCLMNFLGLYFPKEVHKKQKDDDRERVAEEMEAITGLRIEERETCIVL